MTQPNDSDPTAELIARLLAEGDTPTMEGSSSAGWSDEEKLGISPVQPTATDELDILRDANGTPYGVRDPKTGKEYRYPTAAGSTEGRPTVPAAGSDQAYIPVMDARGTISWNPNPNYQKPAPKDSRVTAGSSERYIVTRNEKGELVQELNPNYRDPAASAAASRKPLSETFAEIDYTNKSKLQTELEGLAEQVRMGYLELPAAARQADLLKQQALEKTRNDYAMALQGLQGTQAKELAGEQSRLRVEEFNATEKPYKDAAVKLQQDQANLARGQAQAAVLGKQAEQGQAMLNAGVEAGVAPPIEAVKAAYSPLDAALRILNSGWQPEQTVQAPEPTPIAAPVPR